MEAQEEKKEGMKDTFSIKHGGENKAQILTLLRDIKEAKLTHQNFNTYVEQVNNSIKILNAQIESEYVQYMDYLNNFRSMKNEDRIRGAMEKGIVPKDFSDVVMGMHYRLKQITSWKFLQYALSSSVMSKLSVALSEAKALDIQKEVLQQMKEMDEKRNNMFLDIMLSRNKEFVAALSHIQKTDNIDRKENTQILASAIIKTFSLNKEIMELLIKHMNKTGDIETASQVSDLSSKSSDFEKEITTEVIEKEEPEDIVLEVNKIAEEQEKEKLLEQEGTTEIVDDVDAISFDDAPVDNDSFEPSSEDYDKQKEEQQQ